MAAPARMASYRAPVMGWNTVDGYDGMKMGYAVTLDNFFPDGTKCRMRGGYVSFCDTATGDPVKTLIEYTGPTASKLIAASDGDLYEISTGTPATLDTGFASDVWEGENFSTAGGSFLILANGEDDAQQYDGTNLTALGETGPTNKIHSPTAFTERMFYAEVDTLSVWYSAAGAYTGALTEFNVGALCSQGGQIAALGTWTKQNASLGSNELFVIITTGGEILVYQGTDPSVAADWSIVGRFVVGKPVSGRRCVRRVGSDMVLLCEDGYQTLSKYLPLGRSQSESTGISNKISPTAVESVAATGTVFGWTILDYPRGSALIVNVPLEASGLYDQHVVNTNTGAWCRYRNIPALCWSLMDGAPYFGASDGRVWKFDTGTGDNGTDICAEMIPAFQMIGKNGLQKHFMMARPHLATSQQIVYSMGLSLDYVLPSDLATISSNPSSPAVWDDAVWDVSTWAGGSLTQQRNWATVSGFGFAAAPHVKFATHTTEVEISGFDVTYEQGAFI